jgi:secreted trypsin-like serine protease
MPRLSFLFLLLNTGVTVFGSSVDRKLVDLSIPEQAEESDGNNAERNLIVGGENADADEFPCFVEGVGSDASCGGSLIHRYVTSVIAIAPLRERA